jgi:hypothetical protein
LRETILNPVEEGPFTEQELMALANSGKIKLKTQMRSPTRTKNQLIYAEAIPKLAKTINDYKLQVDSEKQRKAEEEKQNKLIQRMEVQRKKDELIEVKANAIRQLTDSSVEDPSKVDPYLAQEVSKILTNGETIFFTCTQSKPMLIKPDSVVCTNRRLIIYKPKLLGRFDFFDFLWRDLKDATLKQGIIGSTFMAQHISGNVITIEWLPKERAQALYRLAQEREELAIEERRNRQMEETAAGASKINIATNVAPVMNTDTSMANQSPRITADPMEKLKTLKGMLDAGLITEADFEAKKQKLLDEM